MTNKLLLLAAIALVATPILAGCAQNGETTPTTPTSATPTPTGTTPTPTSPTPPVSTEGMKMKLGIMVPLTGPLNNLGPDMRDAALLAVEQINAANLGLQIETFVEDDKTTDTSAAPGTFQRLVGQGVSAVIGPCCSGVTASVLEPAVQNEVVVASMSATSPSLTLDRENDGYFWRIAPSDAVQGKVLAQLVKDSGVSSVNMLIVNNPYGNGLTQVFEETYGGLGGTVTTVERYNEGAQEFSSAITNICASSAEGLVFVAYVDDGANVLRGMQSQGCLSKFTMFAAEGMYAGEGNEGLPAKAGQDSEGKWLAAGIKGTNPQTPETTAGTTFRADFEAKYGHAPNAYAAESYDAVMYVALASLHAKSVNAVDFRQSLDDVANSGVGKTKVSSFTVAAPLAAAGAPLDWGGAGHDFDFDARNEPATGIYSIWTVNAEGQTTITETGKSA